MSLLYLLSIWLACCMDYASGQQPVTFSPLQGSGEIRADLYGSGTGTSGVVLAHGGQFNKESWKEQAQVLAHSGFRVLAIRFRGDGLSPDGSPGSFGSTAENAADVLAAVWYLHRLGVRTVAAVGASLGGDAVGEANAASAPGNIDRIVILASSGGGAPERLSGRKLFIVARDDKNAFGLRMPEISSHYERVPEPKKLVILQGSAHAQHLFKTDQGPRLLLEIVQFLSAP